MMSKPLAIAAAVLVGLLIVSGILLKMAWAENGKLEVKLAAANAVIAQREDDMKLSAQIVAQQAQALSNLQTKVVTQIERIYAAPVTRACADSPAMRAATIGVRDIISGDRPPAGRQPPAPLH